MSKNNSRRRKRRKQKLAEQEKTKQLAKQQVDKEKSDQMLLVFYHERDYLKSGFVVYDIVEKYLVKNKASIIDMAFNQADVSKLTVFQMRALLASTFSARRILPSRSVFVEKIKRRLGDERTQKICAGVV